MMIHEKDQKNKEENEFKPVKIGNQEWMSANLNVDQFRNGDPIPEIKTEEDWAEYGEGSKPSWCYYANKPENGKKFGKLYNWYAVNDSRGLAPEGWHVSSDAEWTELIDYLGGYNIAGGKMKETGYTNWDEPNTGATNESGFSAFPGGYLNLGDTFYNIGCHAYFWSSTERPMFDEYGKPLYRDLPVPVSNHAWYRGLNSNYQDVFRDNHPHAYGFSVRCVKD